MIVHLLSPSLMLFHHSFFVVEFLPVFHCFPPFITCFHTVLINFFLPQMNLLKKIWKNPSLSQVEQMQQFMSGVWARYVYVSKSQTYTVQCTVAPGVTGSVFRLFLAQCEIQILLGQCRLVHLSLTVYLINPFSQYAMQRL